jgi:hypothetical protein
VRSFRDSDPVLVFGAHGRLVLALAADIFTAVTEDSVEDVAVVTIPIVHHPFSVLGVGLTSHP